MSSIFQTITPMQLAGPSHIYFPPTNVLPFSLCICTVCQQESSCTCFFQGNSGPLPLPPFSHSHYGWLPGNETCCFHFTAGPLVARTDWENAPLFHPTHATLPLVLCSNCRAVSLTAIPKLSLCKSTFVSLCSHRKLQNWVDQRLDFTLCSGCLLSMCLCQSA